MYQTHHHAILRESQFFQQFIQFFFNQNSTASTDTKRQITWKISATSSNIKHSIFFCRLFIRFDDRIYFFHRLIIIRFDLNICSLVLISKSHSHSRNIFFNIIFIRQIAFETINRKSIQQIFCLWIEWFENCSFSFHH